MKDDFDFDDLDAAVVDLLNNVRDNELTVHDRDVIVAAEKSEIRKNQNQIHNAKNQNGANTATSGKPKSFSQGRFMDMVHSSSDATVAKKQNYAKSKRNISEMVSSEKSLENNRQLIDHKNNEIREVNKSVNNSVSSTNTDDFINELAQVIENKPKTIRKFRGGKSVNRQSRIIEKSIQKPVFSVDSSLKKSDKVNSTPFLVDAKVEKKPLSSAIPTGENAKSKNEVKMLPEPQKTELLSAYENMPEDAVNYHPEIALSEDNFVSKFLGEIKNEAYSERDRKLEEDMAPKINREGLMENNNRAAISNSMSTNQHKDINSTQPKSPFSTVVHDKSKRLVWPWILLFILLLMTGFAAVAWWYLLS